MEIGRYRTIHTGIVLQIYDNQDENMNNGIQNTIINLFATYLKSAPVSQSWICLESDKCLFDYFKSFIPHLVYVCEKAISPESRPNSSLELKLTVLIKMKTRRFTTVRFTCQIFPLPFILFPFTSPFPFPVSFSCELAHIKLKSSSSSKMPRSLLLCKKNPPPSLSFTSLFDEPATVSFCNGQIMFMTKITSNLQIGFGRKTWQSRGIISFILQF